MKRTYASLNEKDRRRFAAIEALKEVDLVFEPRPGKAKLDRMA